MIYTLLRARVQSWSILPLVKQVFVDNSIGKIIVDENCINGVKGLFIYLFDSFIYLFFFFGGGYLFHATNATDVISYHVDRLVAPATEDL